MAARYVSFDEVKARVTMEQLLEYYNLLDDQAKRKGDELALHCVFHANDTTPSLKINTAKNIFNCFGCNSGGDVIGFVVLKEGIATGDYDRDRREAALLLQDWFGIAGTRSKKSPRRSNRQKGSAARTVAEKDTQPVDGLGASETPEPAREREEAAVASESETLVNVPLKFELTNLDADHPYLQERGLAKETIVTFGLGYFGGRGTMHGRIVIPIHDGQGEHLLAYAGRWPGDPPEDEPKYKLPANFHKSLVLYNLHRARDHATEGLIVVEGFMSVFTLWQKGRRNVVAVMGNHISLEQEQLITATVGPKGRVLIAFDDDEAGRKGSADAAARLTPHVFVRTISLA
jgi:DNA primase